MDARGAMDAGSAAADAATGHPARSAGAAHEPALAHQRSLPLLCERCGYDIDALPDDAHCPECGTPRVESLPERRTGTPWQRRGTFRSLAVTIGQVWFCPRRFWATMRAVGDSDLTYFVLLISACMYGVSMGYLLVALESIDGSGIASMPGALLMALIPGLGIGCVFFLPILVLLTWIESRGLRVIGRVHKFRITPEVSSAVCAHAAAGWITGGLLAIVGAVVGRWLNVYASTHNVGVLRGFMMLSPGLLPLIAFAIGMLHFETLAYLGMRRMRYANAPIADASSTAQMQTTRKPPAITRSRSGVPR